MITGPAKRFYQTAELAATDRGFRVLLDGRAMKTPAGADFVLPTHALARAVMEEWLAQTDMIRPGTLPATRLAATAIDRVSTHRQAVVDQLIAAADFDLLFYRAADPPELALRQHACWQPLLDWATGIWKIPFAVTSGVMPVSQPAEVAVALAATVDRLADMELTGVASVAQASGSLIIALALAAERIDAATACDAALLDESYQIPPLDLVALVERIDAATACDAALLDESYQIERWGLVEESTQRRQRLKDDIVFADRFIALCRNTERAADRSRGHAH